jgi:RimJ/RimL family protein N-acetyltransferase
MLVSGEQIYLRTIRESDLDWIYEKDCDLAMRGDHYPIYFDSQPGFKDEFHKTGFWDDDGGDLLICDGQTDVILGVIFCFKTTPYWDNLEVGYRLYDLKSSGRGIVTEALHLFSYLLFASKKINRLELKIFPENAASKRVAAKCGYQLEGIARGGIFHRGAYRDMEVYSLLRGEAPNTLEDARQRVPKEA